MSIVTNKETAIIGCGVIGTYIFRAVSKLPHVNINYIYDADKERTRSFKGVFIPDSLKAAAERPADLVIEAATSDVVKEIAGQVLKKSDMLVFSDSSLADDDFRQSVRDICRKHGTRLYVPHGAILGLDGIADGRNVIEAVEITTTKNPLNLGLQESVSGTLYEGSTRDACQIFPRNVNVHASVAIFGLGFDKTRSVIIADPNTKKMTHDIHVAGKGMEWQIRVSSEAVGSVSGSYTLESAARTVERILDSAYDITLA